MEEAKKQLQEAKKRDEEERKIEAERTEAFMNSNFVTTLPEFVSICRFTDIVV